MAVDALGRGYDPVALIDPSTGLPVGVGGGSSGSVTAPGTAGTQAQAVQGVPGGVPQNVQQVDGVIPSGSPYSLAALNAATPWIDQQNANSVTATLTTPDNFSGSVVFETSARNDGTGVMQAFGSAAGASFAKTAAFAALGPTTIPKRARYIRFRVSGYTSGTAVVAVTLDAAQPVIDTFTRLTDSSAVIGSTTARSAGTNRSTAVGTAAVTLMPANTARQGWKIKNDSAGDLWINFDGTATSAAGGGNIKIAAGAYLASEPGFVETGAMSAIGSAAGLAITAREH